MLITLINFSLAEINEGLQYRKSFLHAGSGQGWRNYFRSDHLKRLKNSRRRFLGMVFFPLWMGLSGCGDREVVETPMPEEVSLAVVLTVEGLPGLVHESQAGSKVRWRPWAKSSFDEARAEEKLVVAVVVLPQQTMFKDVLAELEASASVLRSLNEDYVPVLVDADVVKEMGILAAEFCAEIGAALQLPLFVWMTPDRMPVAWIPILQGSDRRVTEVYEQSHEMISGMWRDNRDYVDGNSRMDQENRALRLVGRLAEREMSGEPAQDSVRALRQLTSLYDRFSRTFDEAGGLFPAGALDLLSLGGSIEGLPEDVRERCVEVLDLFLDDLLRSPMFDPLEGAVFSARRGSSWSFPSFVRDCSTQARVAVSLVDAYGSTGNELALETALRVVGFAEEMYRTVDGLFALNGVESRDLEKWLWSEGDVMDVLDLEEARWWMLASGMSRRGNVPPEVDPQREFLRLNTISRKRTAGELAEEYGEDVAVIEKGLASAAVKLLAVRNGRMGAGGHVGGAHAVSSFRMVSAYSALYRATGDVVYREKAVALMERSRAAFGEGPRLRMYDYEGEGSLLGGRASVYALVMLCCLDLAAVTLDERWLFWADDLGATMAELFVAEGFVREVSRDADLMGLPVSDLSMLLDESTIGMASMAEARMEALGRPLMNSLGELVRGVPTRAMEFPILHTDVLQGSIIRHFGTTYVYGDGLAEDLEVALTRLPIKAAQRRTARGVAEVGDGLVLRVGADKEVREIKNAEELDYPSLRGGVE